MNAYTIASRFAAVICAVLLIVFVAACTTKRVASSSPASAPIIRAAGLQGARFASESDLIEALGFNRNADFEYAFFDSEFRVLEDGESVGIGITTDRSLAIKGSFTLPVFCAIAYDDQLRSFKGFSGNEGDYVSLAVQPSPGIVVIGIVPTANANERNEISAVLKFIIGAESGERIVSKAPEGDQNVVDDLTVDVDSGNRLLNWTEKNVGDYNNDSEVGIPDITPIAQNFNVAVDHGNPDDPAAIIDGDNNDEVGISDITPIAQNYLSMVASYNVFRWQSASGWAQVGNVTRPATPDPAYRPPAYDHTDTGAVATNTFYAVIPVDSDDKMGIPSIVVGVPGADPGSKPNPPDPDAQPATRADLAVSGVMKFDVPAGESRDFDVVLNDDATNYILAFLSYGDPSLTESTVTVTKGTPATPSSLRPPQTLSLEMTDEAKLNLALERQAEKLLRDGKRPTGVSRTPAALGDSRAFNIVYADMDPETLDTTVTGFLRAENIRVRIWIDQQVDDTRFAPALLNELAASTRDIILTQEETAYGGIYDPDNDDKFDIFLTPQINALPGLIRGLFVTNDLQDTVGTNTTDLIYLDVPDCTGGTSPSDPLVPIAPGIFDQGGPISVTNFENSVRHEIAHELQHLLNYSNRLKIRDRDSVIPVMEATWLNEGMSHFTEDFVGYQSVTNYTLINAYLSINYVTPVIWDTSLDGPYVRGGCYLLVRYIFEQYGVNAVSNLLLKNLPTTQYAGIDNVENATGKSMTSILQDWLATMSFAGWDNTPASTYVYATPTTNPETDGLSGVTFFEEFTDYNGNAAHLARPVIQRLTDAPLSITAKPNSPAFVLINNTSASMPRITVNADTGFPVYGVFARAADQAQAYENTGGSTPFEFFRLFSGDISTGGQRDDYSINVPSDGKIYVHVVSCLPDELEPVIYVNGDVQSDSIPLPGAASFNFNLIGGGGGLTFGVSGNDGSTGEYIISAEFYPA